MLSQAITMTMKAISFLFGFYASIVVATYLGFVGIKKYLSVTSTK